MQPKIRLPFEFFCSICGKNVFCDELHPFTLHKINKFIPQLTPRSLVGYGCKDCAVRTDTKKTINH